MVCVALIIMGSSIDSALFKSGTVFICLIAGTRTCVYLFDIIGENPQREQESHSHN
ncbi:hypothetical protein SAMN06265218_10695 [Fodinibius sediminis]|uniref:Uncharacterized protein n=1 Tax=Fodinibius sediminis TaxID=1214077 RepID=A0A521CI27_9BACT|nr:hypothetical protein SAMN06265218_10695 [Fodinibius sediminis]